MNGRTGAGRPSNKIKINSNRPKISLNQIKVFCKNKTIKENVCIFASALMRGPTSSSILLAISSCQEIWSLYPIHFYMSPS